MLKTRLITAAILLPLVLGLFVLGPAWFVVTFILLCLLLTVREAANIMISAFESKLAPADAGSLGFFDVFFRGERAKHRQHALVGITMLIGGVMLLVCANSRPEASVGIIAGGALLALLIGTFSARTIELGVARATGMLVALIYGSMPWIVVWHVFLLGDNSRYVLLVMAVTWMGDTGGYFGGRFYGGKIFGDRKLAPTISPKKTWEGAVVGLFMSVVGGIVLNLVFLGRLAPFGVIVITSLIGGIFAQLGDLVESLFKRFAGVKDSGTIIPGHGGFLDRVDGILFAAPVVWAMIHYTQNTV